VAEVAAEAAVLAAEAKPCPKLRAATSHSQWGRPEKVSSGEEDEDDDHGNGCAAKQW